MVGEEQQANGHNMKIATVTFSVIEVLELFLLLIRSSVNTDASGYYVELTDRGPSFTSGQFNLCFMK